MQREADRKHAALTDRALHGNSPAHQLHEAVTDRQPHARSAEGAGQGVIGLGKGLEQTRQNLRIDTHAGVGDRQQKLVALSGGLDLDPPRRRELQAVGDQVVEQLMDAPGIAQPVARCFRSDVDRQSQSLVLGHQAGGFAGPGDDRLQIEGLVGELDISLVQIGQVENLVQQGEQGVARFLDQFDPLPLDLDHRLAQQGLAHPQHAIQRRPELVAHIGQEALLEAIGPLGRVARGGDLRHGALQVQIGVLQGGQQAIEALRESPDLVRPRHRQAHAAIMRGRRGVHRVREVSKRPKRPAGKLARHEAGAANRQRRQYQGDQDVEQPGVQQLPSIDHQDDCPHPTPLDAVRRRHLQIEAAIPRLGC